METIENRLLDEALREPVKNAFRLGWEFVDQNRLLALSAVGVLVLLTLLKMVPLVGFFAAAALGIFLQAAQIYVGRTFYQAESIGQFVEAAAATRLQALLTRFIGQAFGAWLGWIVLGVIFFVLWMVLALATGMNITVIEGSLNSEAQTLQFFAALGLAALPLVLAGLVLAYVFPVVQGRIILSESVGEAFRAVFSMFRPAVWSHAMNGQYFTFVLIFGLVMIGVGIAAAAVLGLLMMIPVLGPVLGLIVSLLLFYVLIMIVGVANVMARELAEG